MRKSLSVTSVSVHMKRLQALDPFEIGNDHAAGVAKNVGNDEELVPALRSESCRLQDVVGPFAPSARMRHFDFAAFFSLITRSTAARSENVAWHARASRSGSTRSPSSNARRFPFFKTCCSAAFDIDAFWIVERRSMRR